MAETTSDDAADAARYRFLRQHLMVDGEVDDADYATTQYNALMFTDESLPLPNGFFWGDVDAAIDAARALAPLLPAPHHDD